MKKINLFNKEKLLKVFKGKRNRIIKISVFVLAIVAFCVGISILISDKDSVPREVLGSSGQPKNEEQKKDEAKKEETKDPSKELDSKYESIEKDSSIKKAYLTFDDGPSNNTKKILDILDANDVKATFFVMYHEGCDDLYKEIVARGHQIALHTYTHNYEGIYASEEAYFNDLNKIHDYVKNITGVDSKIIRFPGGSSNMVSKKYCQGLMTKLVNEVSKKGYKYYDWNADSTDASGNGVPVSKLLEGISNSSDTKDNCVLMHDTDAKGTTVEALPEIIKHFKDRGYKCIPITNNTKEFHHANLNN